MTVLKGSIENHGKSIVRAAQIDARQRNCEQLRGAVLTLDAEKRALEKVAFMNLGGSPSNIWVWCSHERRVQIRIITKYNVPIQKDTIHQPIV